MARSGTHRPPEVKAAVMAALLAGQSLTFVAEQFDIPKTTVHDWRVEAFAGRPSYDDMVDTYIRESLETLAEQQKHFRDPVWLGKQPAAELAVLHGVTADKMFRLFEAVARAHQDALPVAGTV